ncbi:hypothetical protein ACJ6WF_17850 [Streptomyces sp. MMS24-I2-30]|uniref:hypothetical protein n=1 Tax=Streptomyces sp. MMS24-I2-30 TaxID=3351564 RepID=UPI0038968B7F
MAGSDVFRYLASPWKSSIELTRKTIAELPWKTIAEIVGKSGLEGAPHAIQAAGIFAQSPMVYAIGVGVNGDVGAKAVLEEVVRWAQDEENSNLNYYKVGAGIANMAGLGVYAASNVGAVGPAVAGAGAQIAGGAYLVIEGSSGDPERARVSIARRAMDAGREGYSYMLQGYGTGIQSKPWYAAGLAINGLVGAQAFFDELRVCVRAYKNPDENLPKPNYGKMFGGILNMAGAVGYAVGSSGVLDGVLTHKSIDIVRAASATVEAISYGVIIGSEVTERVAAERHAGVPLLPMPNGAVRDSTALAGSGESVGIPADRRVPGTGRQPVSGQVSGHVPGPVSGYGELPAIDAGPSLSNSIDAALHGPARFSPGTGKTQSGRGSDRGPVPPVDAATVLALTPTWQQPRTTPPPAGPAGGVAAASRAARVAPKR